MSIHGGKVLVVDPFVLLVFAEVALFVVFFEMGFELLVREVVFLAEDTERVQHDQIVLVVEVSLAHMFLQLEVRKDLLLVEEQGAVSNTEFAEKLFMIVFQVAFVVLFLLEQFLAGTVLHGTLELVEVKTSSLGPFVVVANTLAELLEVHVDVLEGEIFVVDDGDLGQFFVAVNALVVLLDRTHL